MKRWCTEEARRVFLDRANVHGRQRDRWRAHATRYPPTGQREHDQSLARWAVYDYLWDQSLRGPPFPTSRAHLLETLNSLRFKPRFREVAYDEAAFCQEWVSTVKTLLRIYQKNDRPELP